jgi:two-component system sensor histidine kinase KdpD
LVKAKVQALLARYGYVFAILAIAVSTAIFYPGREHFAQGHWALLYLRSVVFVASSSGTGPALLAAVLAFFAWDFYFLPPYHTLQIRDYKDLLSLLAFLVVGVLVGIQTGLMREREARAVARERETAALNRLSAGLVSQTSTKTMAETVLSEIVQLVGADSAQLFVAENDRLRSFCVTPPQDSLDGETARLAEWAYAHGVPLGLPVDPSAAVHTPAAPGGETTAAAGETSFRALGDAGGVFLPLLSPSGVTGVLTVAARRDGRPYGPAEGRLLASLANLVAVFLERQNLQLAATSAEAAREADRLKSSLLSSVSHELKTPLAALTASVSNLLEGDVTWDEQSVRDELRAVVANIARLNNSIGALLDLSRLEARQWEPHREPYELADILATAFDTLPAHLRTRITIDLPDDLPALQVDFAQWARVLQNLLENALLYAGSQTTVTVGARASADGTTRLWVEDEGPGVPADEHEAVFEKFYRGRQTGAQAPSGTGLGLAITREIVRAHDGTIHIEDVSPHGARFMITLPAATAATTTAAKEEG